MWCGFITRGVCPDYLMLRARRVSGLRVHLSNTVHGSDAGGRAVEKTRCACPVSRAREVQGGFSCRCELVFYLLSVIPECSMIKFLACRDFLQFAFISAAISFASPSLPVNASSRVRRMSSLCDPRERRFCRMDDLVRPAPHRAEKCKRPSRTRHFIYREPGDRTPAVIEPLKLVCVGNQQRELFDVRERFFELISGERVDFGPVRIESVRYRADSQPVAPIESSAIYPRYHGSSSMLLHLKRKFPML